MSNLRKTFELLKNNKNEIQIIKIMVLIIVNTWLLIIFWKVLIIENVFMGNNVAINKMNTMVQPILMYLGLDILTPNTIKMVMVTTIVITVNMMVLHLQTMISVMITAIVARYGYKMYTNYLINSENMKQEMVQSPKEILREKAVEQVPIIINTGSSAGGGSWWMWGGLALGLTACVVLLVWSHQTNANNLLDLTNNTAALGTGLNNRIDNINQKTTILDNQLKLNSQTTRDYVVNINDHFTAVEKKIDNNFQALEVLKDNYAQITKLSNSNTLELSQKSVNLSEKAVGIMQEMSEISSATEGVTLALARFYAIINNQDERLTLVESKVDTISGVTTPRSSTMFRGAIPNRFNPLNKDES